MSSIEENAESTVPSILITSSDPAFKEEELIKQILSTECLPEPVKREETVTWYPWTLNNKYYTADVRLCTVPSTFQMTSEIAQSMQAFIAYFDSTAKDGLEKLSPWISVVEDLGPEVLILVCDRVCEQGVSRHTAQQWCLAHAFELVELNPQDLPDEDDDFPESTGVKRILQALNANVWSSVEMKDEHNQGFGLMSSLVANRHNNVRSGQNPPVSEILNSHCCCVTELCQSDTSRWWIENTVMSLHLHNLKQQLASGDLGLSGHANSSFVQSSSSPAEGANESEVPAVRDSEGSAPARVETIVDPMTHLDIQELANLTAGDADVENFERLFTKLKEMKDKASSLPHDQRKVHAEKVAKAFWMAIGGEADEVEDLSSGEES